MKIDLPVYTTKLPVKNATVEFTPIIVKEEKNIIAAKETGGNRDGYNTLLKILESKTNLKVRDLSETDLIHLILELRKKSIGEKFKTSFNCPKTNQKVDVDVDVGAIELIGTCKESTIKSGDLIVHIKMPSDFSETISAIASVETMEEKIDFDSISDNEKQDIVDSFPVSLNNEIKEKIQTLYHYVYNIEYTTNDVTRRIKLSSAEDFFTLLFAM